MPESSFDVITVEMERDKTVVLGELLNAKSDNFNKIDVSDLILKYFEMSKPVELKIRRSAWEVHDQAVRQLHTASLKVPRRRYFPGSHLERCTQTRPQYSREASLKKAALDQAKEDRFNRLRSIRTGEPTGDQVDGSQILENLAAHMVENDLTAAAVQRQISAAAAEGEEVENAEHLHELAVNLVREVLVKANRHVHDYMLREDTEMASDEKDAALEREDTHVSQMSITRIESIAKEMVQSVTDQVTAMLEAEQLQEERP